MLIRLVEHTVALDDAGLARVPLQDAALCRAWYASYADPGERPAEGNDLPAVVERWGRVVVADDTPTEGRRQQWVLRDLIDVVLANNEDELDRDELDLLCAAHDLAHNARDHGVFDRVLSLLEPHIDYLRQRQGELGHAPGLPAIEARLHVVRTEDIAAAPARQINVLMGIDRPFTGPVYTYKGGHVRVLGNVPEGCTLVVETGSCSIEGFVMGRVAATRHCEVHENVSGDVVVRYGNIRARNIIVRAFVVSKAGEVVCRRAENPDLVFASRRIEIEADAVMGRFIAPEIRVHGTAEGGEYHVAGRLEGDRLRSTETRPLQIVMRRELTCQDYGEAPGAEATHLMGRATRLRRRHYDLTQLRHYSERETESQARAAIAYLTGQEEGRAAAERIQECERRLASIERLISGLNNMALVAEDRLNTLARFQNQDVDDLLAESDEAGGAADTMQNELSAMSKNKDLDRDIQEALADLGHMKEAIYVPQRKTQPVLRVWNQARDAVARWSADRDYLIAHIDELQKRLASDAAAAAGQSSQVHLLTQLLTRVRDRAKDPNDPVGRRVQSGYMRVALRAINGGLERIRHYNEELARTEEEYQTNRTRLNDEFFIVIENSAGGRATPAIAEGRFTDGARIFANHYLIDEPSPPPGSVLVTRDTGNARFGYTVRDGKVARVEAHE